MAVFYKKVEKGDPRDRQAVKKWYATVKRINQIKEKEVARQISDETTLNSKEVEMVLSLFQKTLIRLLSEGNSVQLGDWGSFHLTCCSKGHENKEELTANSIEKVNIRFVAGKNLRHALEEIVFKDVDTLL
ncbi:MAG: HU family DNA-binding protein [Tannerellaceae bacterium]|jgi:predicted histone-like DNA-binding protein|nr:HU family DNA-binding protein [Tannerellaceae bacterium]